MHVSHWFYYQRWTYTQAIALWERWLQWAYQFTTRQSAELSVQFHQHAQCLFDDEQKEQRKLVLASAELSPSYAAHLGKHPGMLAEVALIFHVFAGTQPSGEISADTMNTAIRYMRRIRKHAYSMYSSILSSAPAFDLAQALARSIVAADEALTTIGRDWMTQHCQAFKKADDRLRREAVQILEDADWLEGQLGARAYGGWPRSFNVHDKVFQMFAREGEQWRARRAAVRDAIGDEA